MKETIIIIIKSDTLRKFPSVVSIIFAANLKALIGFFQILRHWLIPSREIKIKEPCSVNGWERFRFVTNKLIFRFWAIFDMAIPHKTNQHHPWQVKAGLCVYFFIYINELMETKRNRSLEPSMAKITSAKARLMWNCQ